MDKAIQLAADLKTTRDTIRMLLGGKYREVVAPIRARLREYVSQYPTKSLADIALQWAKKVDADGCDPSLVMAAFVDETEAVSGEPH